MPTHYQKQVRKALEGNERVWFHPDEERIAVWYGGPVVSIYNSRTWREVDEYSIYKGYDIEADMSEVEDAVVVTLAQEGFDRCGRTQDDTRVVEA